MEMESVIIGAKKYQFISHYQKNDILREKFNALTKKTYGFDFEKWYKSGYWGKPSVLYSLLDEGTMVSHVTASTIHFNVLGEMKKYIQFGTVMTDPLYQKRGLVQFLIRKIIQENEDNCDLFYLFANDNVLDFYPKFGFKKACEYSASIRVTERNTQHAVRRLHMENPNDRNLLYYSARCAKVLSQCAMYKNAGLVLFYCYCFGLYNLYYIKNLKVIAVAEYTADTLILYDIFSLKGATIDDVIAALSHENTKKAVLLFTPIDLERYTLHPFKEENATLFIRSKKGNPFDDHKLIFPLLSHT
ncbi:MAG: GNAT family N-acetyltransferase [Eubacterium sp.]